MNDIKKAVPEQQEGAKTHSEFSVTLLNEEKAHSKFLEVKQRMLDINHWQEFAGSGTAKFELMDEQGEPTTDPVQKGSYFRIDIPGPGSKTGDGYDWVQVEEIRETSEGTHYEGITLRVRPTSNPRNQDPDIAHFYNEMATSNFIVERKGQTVTAAVEGRNEKPNVEAQKLIDKTRNAAVGLSAAAGISSIQWNALVKGLINKKESDGSLSAES